LGIGLSELRLSPDEFYDLTFEEYEAMLTRSRERENARVKEEYERMRLLAFRVCEYTGHMKKGMSITQFMNFTWDKPTAVSKISQLKGEERKEAARKLIEERQKQLETFLNKSKN
jgi:hypothetical protein